MNKYLLYGVAALGVTIVAATGYLLYDRTQSTDRFAQCRATSVAGGTAAIGGPFTLVDSTGRTVSDADVITEPSLIYFGYTFCPDVCPLDVARNAEVTWLLEEDGRTLKPVFISVDPQRDTPEVLAEFTKAMHPRMVGLTGSPEQVRAASQAYRTYYRIHEAEGDDPFYLIDHSTFSYLVLPGHGFVEFFRRDEAPEPMAARVACFIDRA